MVWYGMVWYGIACYVIVYRVTLSYTILWYITIYVSRPLAASATAGRRALEDRESRLKILSKSSLY